MVVFQKNKQFKCKILNYLPKERTFEVEIISTKVRGKVIFVGHYEDISYMEEAYLNNRVVSLYFDRYDKSFPLFKYRIYEDNIVSTKQDCHEGENSKLSISMAFSQDNAEYNEMLFEALYNSLGNFIDSDEKYSLAKQLISINRQLKIRLGLSKELFKISNIFYQTKFWNEGLLPYCSNIGIKKSWAASDDAGRQIILDRLGIAYSSPKSSTIQTYFENIELVILNNILSATSCIYSCMAWFTNFNIYKALEQKLDEGVKIVLLTNNDLINNGGFCLDFNTLINKGLELHLAEYPDLIHHKFCIIDNHSVLTGSYNWTFFSENVNRENLILIKDDCETIKSYIDEFNMLIDRYPIIDQMPKSVPEKPEYDRSSFKQYISEELILRSRKSIGNIQDNINGAIQLSPNYTSVTQAKSEFNINDDNSYLTIEQIENVANATAISERLDQLTAQSQSKQTLATQRADLEAEHERIVKKQNELSHENQHATTNTEISEEERIALQENTRLQSDQLEQQRKEVETTLSHIDNEFTSIDDNIARIEDEIAIIQTTSQVTTEGGRGSLKINLKWNTYDDLDLHVIDPDNVEIYYRNKASECQGIIGLLDVDANASNLTKVPQENIFWEEGKNAPLGRYKVFVEYFAKKDDVEEVPFTVTIYPQRGISKVFTKKVRNVKERLDIVEFDYTENGISYITAY